MFKRSIFIIIILLQLIAVTGMAAEQKVTMEVKGMTCALWQIAIKKSLEGIKGVRDVKISYKKKTASLFVDESITDEALINAVQKAGPYRGKVIERISLDWNFLLSIRNSAHPKNVLIRNVSMKMRHS